MAVFRLTPFEDAFPSRRSRRYESQKLIMETRDEQEYEKSENFLSIERPK